MDARWSRVRLVSTLGFLAVGLAALWWSLPAVAAAHPACPVCMAPDRITVQGARVAGTGMVTDPTALQALTDLALPGVPPTVAPQAHPATGTFYEMTRYFASLTSFSTDGFDHFRYYPRAPGGSTSTTASQMGVIQYEGAIASTDAQQMTSGLGLDTLVGKWFALTPAQEVALQTIVRLARANVLPAASTVPGRQAHPEPTLAQTMSAWPLQTWVLILGAGALAGLAGVWWLRLRVRRLTHPRPHFIADAAVVLDLHTPAPDAAVADVVGDPT